MDASPRDSRTLAPATGPFGEDSSDLTEGPAALYPLRFLGMGLLIVWLCTTHVPTIFPTLEGAGVRTEIDLFMRFGDIATFILAFLLAPRIGDLSRRRALCTGLVGLTAAGTLAIPALIHAQPLLPSGFPFPMALAALSVASAPGGSVLFLLWAQAYSRIGGTQALIFGAGSCVLAAVAAFTISVMLQPWALLACALAPAASLACAQLSLARCADEPLFRAEVRYPLPAKLILLMAFAAFFTTSAGVLIPFSFAGALHRIWGTGLVGAVILALALVRAKRIDMRLLAAISLPLAIGALLMLPIGHPALAPAVSLLGKFSYVWFTFFVLIMLAHVCRRYCVPSLRPFALARAASEGAMLVGIMIKRAVWSAGLEQSAGFLLGCMGVGFVLLIAAVLLWMSERSVTSDWGAAGISLETGRPLPSPADEHLQRCEELARRFGLTERETEVLALLAKRRTRMEIEQELFLSENTVKTHTRHIYQKLGVHSKAELSRVFEQV